MTNRSQDRSLAEALQEALERREALLAGGTEPSEAQASATRGLGREAAALFALAGALSDAAAPVPEPKHVDVFAERLRRAASGAGAKAPRRVLWPRRWQLPGLGMAAAAAAIAIFAGILVPAFRSLPGDSLYSLKRASEQSRLAIVGGSDEGRLRLRLAALRYNEVEGLIERAETSGAGPGLAAASSVANITDPRIVELIEETLEDAQEQIEAAATILIAEPPDVQSLDDLVEVSQRGQQLAEDVAGELPAAIKSPVLRTVVTLARIEAKAKAKRTEVVASQPEPTPPPQPQPCATPTPTPTPAADEDASATAEPRTSSTPEPTATAAPTVTPEPTPCITPEPTPTPTASPTPSPTPFVTPTPSPAQSPTPPAEARRQRPETTRGASPEPTPTGRSFWA